MFNLFAWWIFFFENHTIYFRFYQNISSNYCFVKIYPKLTGSSQVLSVFFFEYYINIFSNIDLIH